jgi:phospholipase/carboxylesterase
MASNRTWIAAGALSAMALGVAVMLWRRPSDDPAPLVILLHGYGATKADLEPLALDITLLDGPRDLRAVFLEGPNRAGSGRAWWREAAELPASRASVVASVQSERGTGPVTLLGFSQGGAMAVDAAFNVATDVACVVALSPAAHPDGPWPQRITKGRSTRFFVAHGTADTVVPIANATALRDALVANGYAVEFLPHPQGHEIPTAVRRALSLFIAQCK